MSRPVLGLDIGGANLKAAHTAGPVRMRPFALWKDPAGLAGALEQLIADMPTAEVLAVTMTGELCDCFASKRQGVAAILDAVGKAAGKMTVHVWRADGQFSSVADAKKESLRTAAANWLALAMFAGRFAPKGPALVLDVGSTTTDIVPLVDGQPVSWGRTDPERLRFGELVYTGVRRTPLCALLPGEGAAELFATTLDAYLVLGEIGEDAENRETADGRPATRAAAHSRLARMLCADLETSSEGERRALALKATVCQEVLISRALERVAGRLPGPPEVAILAGEGEFLGQRSLSRQSQFPPCRVLCLSQQLGPEVSRAACAHAVAVLRSER